MYKAFFHLQRNPFEVSPDPYFIYTTPWHGEAFASLYYGIRSRKGFMGDDRRSWDRQDSRCCAASLTASTNFASNTLTSSTHCFQHHDEFLR